MLGKLIRHDLNYSKQSFFSIAAVMIILSLVTALSVSFNIESSMRLIVILAVSMTLAVVTAMAFIFKGYKESLFGQNGYLFLTLPVSRKNLLLSKIMSALIWYNFMQVVAFIMIITVVFVSMYWNSDVTVWQWNIPHWLEIVGYGLYGILVMNILAFVAITILFMTITLANSSFKGKRVRSIVAGVLGLAYFSIYTRGAVVIGSLLLDITDRTPQIFVGSSALDLAGIISIYEFTNLLPIMIYSLIVGIISYFITLHLLKKRVEID